MNSFDISTTGDISQTDMKKIGTIMKIATIWGILLPSKANKKKDHTIYSYDNRDYVLHPIYCVHFKISYRKKQKHTLKDEEVLAMFSPLPNSKIREMYKNRKRKKVITGQMELSLNEE